MAYNFSAEKKSKLDLQALQSRLSKLELIEFFPIDVSSDSISLGISVPFKVVDDPRFECEVCDTMYFLISEVGFEVFDLFTGKAVTTADIPGLARQISIE